MRRYFRGALIAAVPLLVITACGKPSVSGFTNEEAGTPPPSGEDGGTLDTGAPPNLGTPDATTPGSADDGGGWVTLPDGAVVFEGDAGSWALIDGGWVFEGDAGGWQQTDGGWLFEGDGGGWVEESDGGFEFTGDAGGWVEEADGGWVFTGDASTGDGAAACTNLQCQQGTCGDGGSATLTGHIYDPAGNNPLYKVVAYIPNTAPDPIVDGVNSASCTCGSLYTGNPIATGITGANGEFTIPNAPVGTNIPIVIQIGKWRNYFVIPTVTCGTNDLDTLAGMPKLTLPKTQSETAYSNLPNIAISTGNADSLECLLERVGVSETEYTGTPTGLAGHIHIFAGTSGGGAGAEHEPRRPE